MEVKCLLATPIPNLPTLSLYELAPLKLHYPSSSSSSERNRSYDDKNIG